MIRGLSTLFVLAAGVLALLGAEGAAQSNPFQQLARSGQEASGSHWYERVDGRGRLIFDQSGRAGLVWEEGSMEVVAVYRSRAAGGGEVWLTDTDRTLLRQTNLGGWTYFPPDRRDGVIIEQLGPARTIVGAPAGESELQRAAEEMVDRLVRLSRNEVTVQLTSLSAAENAYIIDALAMIVLGAEAAPRRDLRGLEVVRVGFGEAPRADYDGRTLDVTVDVRRGYAGRPSSDYIRRTIEDGA
ncbi:MAG: DUF4908 domain-containing protein [Oceanicaulis sp.]